jgi:acetylglutamate kinase
MSQGMVHRRPVIIKIGGVTLESHAESSALWSSVIAMHRSRLAAGKGGVVIVHGGGKAVDRMLARLGIVSERREGIRITTAEQIEVVMAVLGGTINKGLAGTISAACGVGGGSAVGLCLSDGGTCELAKTTRFSFDPGFVGDVVGGNDGLVKSLMSGGWLPVFSSIGMDRSGRALNVNADDAAAGLAKILAAESLVLLTDVPGVKDAGGRVVPTLDGVKIDAMIASGEIGGGMIPKVRAALDVSRESGADVFIMSGDDPANLERWARGEALGTRIRAGGGGER